MLFKLCTAVLAACLLTSQVSAEPSSDESAITQAARLISGEAGSHRLILLGEMHGTREVPLLVGRLVTEYASQGPVLLALEVNHSEFDTIRRYLASDGGPNAWHSLISGAFWQRDSTQHDGRRSLDALNLIEQVRLLRVQGRDVAIFPFDNASSRSVGSQARDKAMATRLRVAFAALPAGRVLVLSGNVHAMLERPSFAPPEMQTPMGAHLRDLDPFSVDVTARTGAFWQCRSNSQCGAAPVFPAPGLSSGASNGPFDLLVVLPKFSIARLMGAKAIDQ